MSDAIRVQEIRHFNVIWMVGLKYKWIDNHKCGKSRDEKISTQNIDGNYKEIKFQIYVDGGLV